MKTALNHRALGFADLLLRLGSCEWAGCLLSKAFKIRLKKVRITSTVVHFTALNHPMSLGIGLLHYLSFYSVISDARTYFLRIGSFVKLT